MATAYIFQNNDQNTLDVNRQVLSFLLLQYGKCMTAHRFFLFISNQHIVLQNLWPIEDKETTSLVPAD